MTRHPFLYLLLLIAALAGCRSTGAPVRHAASLNQQIQLAPGEQAAYSAEKLVVEFVRVVEDSRCPSDTTCVWAGEVVVQVSTRIDGGDAAQHEIKMGEHATAGAFRLFVEEVQPARLSTREIAQEEYRVTLRAEPAP